MVYQDKKMKADKLQALIHIYARSIRKRPKKIIILASGSAFRATSAEILVKELQTIMPKDTIQTMGDNLEIPHSLESSVTGLYPPQDHAIHEIAADCCQLMNAVQENMLNQAERQAAPYKSEHYTSSRAASLFTIRPQMSVALLWSLYHAAKEYHEARPWRTFSNSELLKVTLSNGTVAIVMVAGFTDYAGRGAYIFNNLKDVRLCQESKKAMDTYIHHRDCLQFMNRVMVPFHSHDAIAELGLPLASNDLQQEVFPNYFHVHASFSVGDPESPDFIDTVLDKMWNNKPSIQRMHELVEIIRAVTHFASDPRLAFRAEGFSGLHYADQPVTISVGVPNPFQCVVQVVVAKSGQMSHEEAIGTQTLHDKNKCNFCNIPRSPEQKLLGCSRCKYVFYCGSRCQTADFPRHKKECKEMKRKKDAKDLKKQEKKDKKKEKNKKKKKKKEKEKKLEKLVRVRLINLKTTELNGKIGNRGKFMEDKERYEVVLDEGRKICVKPSNLEEVRDENL